MLMRLPNVMVATGLSRSTIYKRINEGTFPAPVRIGPRTVAWVTKEIEEWVRRRISESRDRAGRPAELRDESPQG